MAKWIKVDGGDKFVRESQIVRVDLSNGEVAVMTNDGQVYTAHDSDETTQDFIALFRGLDIGDQA